METLTAPISKTQPAPVPAPAKIPEVTINPDLWIPKFWETVQAVLRDRVAKGALTPLEMGIYQCDRTQLAELHASLDKALGQFSKNL